MCTCHINWFIASEAQIRRQSCLYVTQFLVMQEAYDIGASGRWQATDETGTLESRDEDTEDPPSSKENSREGGRGVLFREM